VPPRLAILGAGVVGCEMAQAWTTLGSSVTLIERGERVLAKEEPFAADQVTDSLRAQGVEVRLAAEATAVRREIRSGTGRAEVTIELEPGEPAVADELLVAAGRRPHTDDLGVETVGLEPGALVAVDDRLRATGVEGDWLYALGDVNGRSLLTHMGKYQARAAVRNILGGDARASQDHLRSPRVTFTDPQVAAVGHTLASAEEAGLNARAVDMETSANAGGSFYGRNAPGTTRIVVDRERSVIVGATFCGAEVVDFLHAATIAVVAEVPLETLFEAVPAFPTRSEVWLNLLEGCGL
jgi:dihydrolipoamide dehydrogenase